MEMRWWDKAGLELAGARYLAAAAAAEADRYGMEK